MRARLAEREADLRESRRQESDAWDRYVKRRDHLKHRNIPAAQDGMLAKLKREWYHHASNMRQRIDIVATFPKEEDWPNCHHVPR